MFRRGFSMDDSKEYLIQLKKNILAFEEDMSLYKIMFNSRMRRDMQKRLHDFLCIIDDQINGVQDSVIDGEYEKENLANDSAFLEIKIQWKELAEKFVQLENSCRVAGIGLAFAADVALAERRERRYGIEWSEASVSSEIEEDNLSVIEEDDEECDEGVEVMEDCLDKSLGV